jgi:hypothetical protein
VGTKEPESADWVRPNDPIQICKGEDQSQAAARRCADERHSDDYSDSAAAEGTYSKNSENLNRETKFKSGGHHPGKQFCADTTHGDGREHPAHRKLKRLVHRRIIRRIWQ